MKYYAPQHKQLTLDLVRSSLDNLDKSNRWVQMGDYLPWPDIEKEYNSKLDNKEKGAGNKPARMIVGAMIVKHKLGLSDQETIDIIRENLYMQYLCGLSEFTDKPIFDSSLFVTIRKRISEEEINAMTTKLLLKQQRILEQRRKQAEQDARDKGDEPPEPEAEDPNAAEFTDSQNRKHKGVLKIDATCADAEVRYPVDSTLLETACRKIDEYTSKVCKEFGITGNTYVQPGVNGTEEVTGNKVEPLHSDGVYQSEENRKFAEKNNIDFVANGIQGKPSRFDLEQTDDKTLEVTDKQTGEVITAIPVKDDKWKIQVENKEGRRAGGTSDETR